MQVRVLPPEEWYRLEGLPIATHGLPDPTYTTIIVVEAGGKIVGTWSALMPVVLEGLWLDEAHRHTTAAGRLLIEMKRYLYEEGITIAYTLVQTPEVLALAEKAGFTKLDGDFCMLSLEGAS